MNIFSVIVCLLLLITSSVRCDLVTFTINNNLDIASLTLCGLYRGPDRIFTKYNKPIINLGPYFNPCNSTLSVPPQGAVYYKIAEPLQCPIETTNVSLIKSGSLSIVALNDRIALELNNQSLIQYYETSYVFFPNKYSSIVDDFFFISNNTNLTLYERPIPFDTSIIIVTMLGLITLITGAVWNRFKFKKDISNTLRSRIEKKSIPLDATSQQDRGLTSFDNIDNETFIHTTWNKLVKLTDSRWFLPVVIILSIDTFLAIVILLHINFKVIEIILSVSFVIASWLSINRIGFHAMGHLNLLTCKLPSNKIPYFESRPQIRHLIFYLFSLILCWIWFGFRFMSWAWVLQDIMVISLVLNFLSITVFKSYKACTGVMLIFMLYDIFMIYFLPMITKEYKVNKSLCFGMQASIYSTHERDENLNTINFNADSGDSDQLPFYLIIPNLMSSNKMCDEFRDFPYSILGIGEILIPAISVNYSIIYDLSNIGSKIPVYFIVNLAGLLISYLVVCLTLSFVLINQAVLVWIVPILIVLSVLTAIIKKDFNNFWHGKLIEKYMLTNSKK